ncbi:hypothetical protein ACOSQ4_032693 [Xanthoceras sorbifolium]
MFMGTTLFSLNRKRAIEELVQGKEFADRLRTRLLQRPFIGGDGSSAVEEVEEKELVGKILRSFTETLSVLSRGGGGGGGDSTTTTTTSSDAAVVVDGEMHDSQASGGRRSENSGESKKRLTGPKGRRGRYERKKNSQTCRIITPTIEDGHAWRKYGQKDILNTRYPRSYFRCTHKYEQGCKATKQVQKMEDNPQMYETIYIGNHTCCRNQVSSSLLTAPQMMIITTDHDHDHIGPWSTSSVLSSTTTSTTATPSTTVVVKKEYNSYFKEEEQAQSTGSGGDDSPENLSSSSHDDHHEQQQMEYSAMWEDLLPLDHHQILQTTTTTCHDFHIDYFDNSELCFDESDFFLPS